MIRTLLYPLALLGALIFDVTLAEAEVEVEVDMSECRLWLAPSYLSTEQKPAFGLYAGSQGFEEEEVIPSYDIALPVFDFVQSPAANRSPINNAVVQLLESHFWFADYVGSKFEANQSTSVFVPGIGALANYHSGISNVDWLEGSVLLREPDEHTQAHTGKAHLSRGAITPYYNTTIRATKPIQPGMELFAFYGDNWDENNVDPFQAKLTKWDYEQADEVLDKIVAFMDTYGDEMTDKLKDDVLDFMLDTVLEGAGGKHAKVIRSLIPAHPDKLQRVTEAGGTFAYRNRDIVKSMEWLNDNGLCVDNLRAGRSTIPDAGRGAFALRAIPEGATISPVPMIPIFSDEVLELYSEMKEVESPTGTKEYVIDDSKPPTGYQLLLNYCFGHPESSLLLLPMAPMVNLINHAPDKSKVNAFLQWSKHDSVFNDHTLHDVPLGDWNMNALPPIVMELVATKDIKEGEEILINYGYSWAKAWEEYQQEWTLKMNSDGETNAKWPLKALDLRHAYKDKPFPVSIKHGQVPYPEGVLTACFIQSVDDLPDGQPRKNSAGQQLVQWVAPKTFEEYSGLNLAVCDLMSRQEVFDDDAGVTSYNYSVITRLKDMSTDKLMEVRNVPHSAITLVDRPYTSDIHAPGAFRHWISMDDQRFPQAWRNLRE
jgi:SET domain